jgi:type I restriction enzyme M protein
MARGKSKNSSSNNSANIGFEAKLWLAADKLRSNMDAAEYKHVVLGLIFPRGERLLNKIEWRVRPKSHC